MTEELKAQHDQNLFKINDIIRSVDNYLTWKQDNHSWRDKSNQSEAMIEYRRRFVSCKENLNNSFNELMLKLNVIVYLKTQSGNLYSEIISDLRALPELTTNSYRTLAWQGDYQSTSSNVNLVKVWEKRYKTIIEDVPRLLFALNDTLKQYNYWLAETELNQMQNYRSMNAIEKWIKDIFQENEEARKFRKCILDHKFQSLTLPPNENRDSLKSLGI